MKKRVDWKIYLGDRSPKDDIEDLPPPPPWRPKRAGVDEDHDRGHPKNDGDDKRLPPAVLQRGQHFHATSRMIEIVNAALYLRRPLLVTGKPGSGKSSLIDSVAYELRLGAPLRWAITSRSSLRDGLYQYDAIGRFQQSPLDILPTNGSGPTTAAEVLGKFITLGPLGTALLPTNRPRALLIDEIDKGDIDLPNDLLNVFEEGEFEIPELKRLGADSESKVFTSDPKQEQAPVKGGVISCSEFPLMVLTSNGERVFPAPFLRRCLRLQMPNPTGNLPEDENTEWNRLDAIVDLHFEPAERAKAEGIISNFKNTFRQHKEIATDQLLNAIYFVIASDLSSGSERDEVVKELMRELIDEFG
jgi:MoxR-like ATPase